MAGIFQFPLGGAPDQQSAGSLFGKFGLNENPFPAGGLESGVLYSTHMIPELRLVNRWLTDTIEANGGPVKPLAMFGALGAGKTHLLRFLERSLSAGGRTPVVRRVLTDSGMTRINLANLILRELPLIDEAKGDEPAVASLRAIVRGVIKTPDRGQSLVEKLGSGSPVREPLLRIFSKGDAESHLVIWLSRWLRRESTTPTQRANLGLAGVLESEGEAIRAVADLARIMRLLGYFKVWFVMIDQLEELWREGVITPSRRARFLTDLRMLVDQGLEGAPIALLLAWNTVVASPRDVGSQMMRDYHALWQRLQRPVDIPQLRAEDVWPFAAAYLEHAGVSSSSENRLRRGLYERLKNESNAVIEGLGSGSPATPSFAPRQVLHQWRETAERIASEEGT